MTSEWKVLVAGGLKQPTRDEEKEVFDYKEFQKVAKAAAPKVFPVFDKGTPEAAAYVATPLLPPGTTRNRARPNKKLTNKSLQGDDRFPCTCHDCKVVHTGPNQHSSEGKKYPRAFSTKES